jgi:hypothetical protein
VQLVPFIGSYMPLSKFGSASRPQVGNIPGKNSTYRESIGVLAGLRLRLELNDRLALEGSGAWVRSGWTEKQEVVGANVSSVGFSLPGSVLLFQARGTLKPWRGNTYLAAGVTYRQRGGEAWDEEEVSTFMTSTQFRNSNVGAVVGFGVRASASPRVLFDIGADLHLYSVNRVERGFVLAGNDPFRNNSMAADVIVTVGIPVHLGGS